MSAEILRRAASLMRERAEAATPGPWRAEYSKKSGHCVIDDESTNCLDSVARTTHYRDSADADHIASWHPAVALLVAAMLEREAEVLDEYADINHDWPETMSQAVARAYLGDVQ